MEVVLGVLLVALAVTAAYASHKKKQKRRADMALWAAHHALAFSPHDPFRLDDLAFDLFSKGDGRGFENVISGAWEGLDVKLADYWYYVETEDSEGRTSRTYRHFSVVVAVIQAWLPKVAITKENALSRLADRIGFRDVEFESEQFNQKFTVKADDREFAFKLVDAPMMQWLLAAGAGHRFEVSGSHVLAYSGRLAPSELDNLLHAINGFLANVPRLVWADYGRQAS